MTPSIRMVLLHTMAQKRWSRRRKKSQLHLPDLFDNINKWGSRNISASANTISIVCMRWCSIRIIIYSNWVSCETTGACAVALVGKYMVECNCNGSLHFSQHNSSLFSMVERQSVGDLLCPGFVRIRMNQSSVTNWHCVASAIVERAECFFFFLLNLSTTFAIPLKVNLVNAVR